MTRNFELVASFIIIIILLPIFAIIVVLIIIDNPGSPFFIQKRVGKDFKLFNLYKFRTMGNIGTNAYSSVTAFNDKRITKVGKILRKTKLDELPQLINVIKGDMSFVGPRPEVIKFIEIYRREYLDILKIKPGITDYATIEFSDEQKIMKLYKDHEEGYINEILPHKINLYKKYIKEKCLHTDIMIIYRTMLKIIQNIMVG
jgi:lipopolysaccharide/colanic/teichoic acid biosynthesis glycosyltransferase